MVTKFVRQNLHWIIYISIMAVVVATSIYYGNIN